MTAEHSPTYSELPPFPWRRVVNPADVAEIGTSMAGGESLIQSVVGHMMDDKTKMLVDWVVECRNKGLNPRLTRDMVRKALYTGYSVPITTMSQAEAYNEGQHSEDTDQISEIVSQATQSRPLSEEELEDAKWGAEIGGLIEGARLALLKHRLNTEPVPRVMSLIVQGQKQKVATLSSSPDEARITEEALDYCEDRFGTLYKATTEAFPEQQ